MNWGKGLAIALIAFAGLMAFFVVKAAQNPEALITERYYEQELKYQQRIDDATRAGGLTGAVVIGIEGNSVSLVFPAEVREKEITGELTLVCMNDPAGDRAVPVRVGEGTFTSAPLQLHTGNYAAQLEWTADGVSYYSEQKLIVP